MPLQRGPTAFPKNKILFKYLLKPSMNSTITTMSLDIAGIFGSAYLVEQIFGFPGLSNYGLQAMMNKRRICRFGSHHGGRLDHTDLQHHL